MGKSNGIFTYKTYIKSLKETLEIKSENSDVGSYIYKSSPTSNACAQSLKNKLSDFPVSPNMKTFILICRK